MIRIPVPPNSLPGLEPFLTGDLWQEWVRRGRVFALRDLTSAVRYLRFKPDVSCRLLLFSDADARADRPPDGFLLHFYADAERAAQAFEKVSKRVPAVVAGYPPFLSRRHAVVGVPFPADVQVPGLRHAYVPRRLARALTRALQSSPIGRGGISKHRTTLSLLAYKPGRRAVFRVNAGLRADVAAPATTLPLHVKIESPQIFPASHDRLAAVSTAVGEPADWGVPAPLGKDRKRWLSVTDWIEGRALSSIARDPIGAREAFLRTGRALAALHRAAPEPTALAPPRDEAERCRRLADDLGALLPDEHGRIGALGARLADLATEWLDRDPVTLHGDFHMGQVIATGTRTFLVDFDEARSGHPAVDLGTFRAHLIESAAPPELDLAFLEGYGKAFVAEHRRQIEVATAVGLLRRAGFPFRKLDHDWPWRTTCCVAAIEALIDRARP